MIVTIIAPYIASLVMMTAMFIVARRLRRVDVVDVSWGLAIVVAAAASLLFSPAPSLASYVAVGLVAVWGYRLSTHIARRFAHSKAQDERYTELMSKWPEAHRWLQVYVKIFLVQSLLALIVALPVIIIADSSSYSLTWLLVGSSIWLLGFAFESVADKQLAEFLGDTKNRGKLMTLGLWHYSRHPNYFGEMTMWWGIWTISVGMAWWWAGIAGPVLITVLLRFVSGVPLAEKHVTDKAGWDDYKRQTPALVPIKFRSR